MCAADEACLNIAHGEPRCMRRAPGMTNCSDPNAVVAACRTLFPSEWAVDGQCYGTSGGPGGPSGIPICLANGYTNGNALWGATLLNLSALGGHQSMADMFAIVRDYTHYSTFTQGSDSMRSIMALRSNPWITDRAFHAVSTENFGWYDDVADIGRHAEVHRIGRGSYVTTGFGGTTNLTLRFNSAFDADAFLIAVPPNETYEVGGVSGGTSTDVCLNLYTLSGSLVATAGCSDGSGTAALRDATATFSTGTETRYIASLTNVLGIVNAGYSLRVRTVSDDYPDAIASAAGAGVLRPGVGITHSLDSTSDSDLFRYDRPSTAGSSALTFSLSGASPWPSLEVYFSTGTTIPTTPIATSSTGSVTIASPSVGHYYARVLANGTTGSRTLTTTAGATCGTTCSGSGTYTSPQSLPTTSGGEVFDRITVANPAADPATTWSGCADGTHCDWYSIDLADNERVSVTTWGMVNTCQLEVAIFAPPEQGFFVGGGGVRYPAARDLTGSSFSTIVGGQFTYTARRGGTFRIAFRSPGSTACGNYWFHVARSSTDTEIYAPPSYF
jgi:hypothetical protein